MQGKRRNTKDTGFITTEVTETRFDRRTGTYITTTLYVSRPKDPYPLRTALGIK